MIGNLIAALIGKHIDESDGEGGAAGAAAGVVTWQIAKRVVPAAVVLGGAALGLNYLLNKYGGGKTPA